MTIRKLGKRTRTRPQRPLRENNKPYMWTTREQDRDSVLRKAYEKEEKRTEQAKNADRYRPNPEGKTFTREEVRDNPEKLGAWLKKPNQYDIVGVDSQEPKPFKPRPGEKLYHGTDPDTLILILASRKIETPREKRWGRIASAGLTTDEKVAANWNPGNPALIELDATALAKKNRLVKIKYEEQWIVAHPEYGRRVLDGKTLPRTPNPTKTMARDILTESWQKEIVSRKGIRFNIEDVKVIRVQDPERFKRQVLRKLPRKDARALLPKIQPL